MKKFWGKYRGKVENNVDPKQLGRIQISVSAVLGDSLFSWALPCVPYAGSGVGFFAIPPVGASVWIEFEGGDPDYPIWAGCFWNEADNDTVPASPATAEMKVFKTDIGTITLNDTPGAGGITIETTAGAKIDISSSGIEINNGQGGKISLSGPQVSVNDGALEVT